jgi:hypothetical protein
MDRVWSSPTLRRLCGAWAVHVHVEGDARSRFPAAYGACDEPRPASCPRVSACCRDFSLQAEPSALHASRPSPVDLCCNHSIARSCSGSECIVIRMPSEGAPRIRSHWRITFRALPIPVINRTARQGTCALPATTTVTTTTQTRHRMQTSLLWFACRHESSGSLDIPKHEAILTFF